MATKKKGKPKKKIAKSKITRRPKKPIVSGIWEQQEGEGQKAYKAFSFYRDTPTHLRSIRRCCDAYWGEHNKTRVEWWEKWSAHRNWQERIKAYESYLDTMIRGELEKDILKMRKEHIQVAQDVIEIVVERLSKLKSEELTTHDVIRYLKEAVKIERISMGTPTEILGFEDIDVLVLTDEELKEVAES